MGKDKNTETGGKRCGGNLAVGLSLGVLFGIVFDNLAVGLCLGVAFGLMDFSKFRKKDDAGGKE